MIDFREYQRRHADGDRLYRLLLPVLQQLAAVSVEDLNAIYLIAMSRLEQHETSLRTKRQQH